MLKFKRVVDSLKVTKTKANIYKPKLTFKKFNASDS